MCELLRSVCVADCCDVLGMTEQMLTAKISLPPPLLSTFISHFLLLSFMYSFRLSLSLLQLSKLSLAICYFFLHHCVTIFLLLMCVLFAFFNSLSPLPRIVLYLLPSQQLYLSSSHPYLLAPLFFPLFPPK